jgi:translation initiation factor IF-3
MNQNLPMGDYLVVDASEGNLGVMPRDKALEMAREKGLDLVEIAAQAKPPVVKIVDFQKFRYEESKKEQAAKKNAKEVELKEIWLTPRIAEHDLMTRLRRVEEFLGDNNKVMFRVKFKGREMAHIDQGFILLNKVYDLLGDKIQVEREAKREGRNITVIIGKNRKGKEAVAQVVVAKG